MSVYQFTSHNKTEVFSTNKKCKKDGVVESIEFRIKDKVEVVQWEILANQENQRRILWKDHFMLSQRLQSTGVHSSQEVQVITIEPSIHIFLILTSFNRAYS